MKRTPAVIALLAALAEVGWYVSSSTAKHQTAHAAAEPPPARLLADLTKANPKDGRQYVWIPAGLFQMSCSSFDSDCDSDEKPAHGVSITRGFRIGQTEVTQAAWKKVMSAANPSHFTGDNLPADSVTWQEANGRRNGNTPLGHRGPSIGAANWLPQTTPSTVTTAIRTRSPGMRVTAARLTL
jgi:formylglycine-generating enzyme required for sulfatase activity